MPIPTSYHPIPWFISSALATATKNGTQVKLGAEQTAASRYPFIFLLLDTRHDDGLAMRASAIDWFLSSAIELKIDGADLNFIHGLCRGGSIRPSLSRRYYGPRLGVVASALASPRLGVRFGREVLVREVVAVVAEGLCLF